MKSKADFNHKVYRLTGKIPRGKVSTYKEIADALGTKAYRLVGQALKENPYAPKVPCHRVVASSGYIGGFMGEISGPAIKRKMQMLRKEGIEFTGMKVKNFDRVVYRFK